MDIGRKVIAILMVTVLVILTTYQIVTFLPAPAIRPRYIETDYIVIDEEAIALANDPAILSVFCDSIIANINEQRTVAGLSSFVKNIDLCAAAAVRAQEQEQRFSHTRPNGSEFWTVNSQVCYGECLSRGYKPEQVVLAWINSPTHRSVLLDNSFKSAGVGVYETNGEIYIALEVGY